MEDLVNFSDTFRGKSVWLSGHTGFKGSWLSTWLIELGARVSGFSNGKPTEPSLFDTLDLARLLNDGVGDIRDIDALRRSLHEARPDFVFHLAAQSLVRRSYSDPIETIATNVLGTVHVLEALRELNQPCAAIFVTSDKCYENREWNYGYREDDRLGGIDPYSSSKAMAEIAINAFRRSFFQKQPVRIASVRAGNVIGGGDWAQDRIVPDCIRALQSGNAISVRNPAATRPWQHVLEPLSGYLLLAARIYQSALNPQPSTLNPLCSAFNFGPNHESNRTVAQLVEEVLKHWPGKWEDRRGGNAPHEAGRLNLATDKAFDVLAWKPVWGFEQTIKQTIGWYKRCGGDGDAKAALEETRGQIREYVSDARAKGLTWSG